MANFPLKKFEYYAILTIGVVITSCSLKKDRQHTLTKKTKYENHGPHNTQ